MARKGKYLEWLEDDKLTLLQGWARRGLTEEQIAHNMGISYSTFRDWKNKFPTFLSALKKGKEVVDLEVESALFKRAMGYKSTETIRERVKNHETGEYELQIVRVIEKDVPPDTTAQIFWLKNRRPDLWRDKVVAVQEVEEVESDGLIDALNKQVEDIYDLDDDSCLLPLEDAE